MEPTETNESPFHEEVLVYLPLNYSYMKSSPKKEVDELRTTSNYSCSLQHNSKHYLTYALYKPLSGILYKEITAGLDVLADEESIGE